MRKYKALEDKDGVLDIEYLPGLSNKDLAYKLNKIQNHYEMSEELKSELLLTISKKLLLNE